MTAFDHTHSVKEIDLARTCLRKWAAKYLHGCTDPKHVNAADGIAMHETLRAMCGPAGPAANTQPESKIGRWARALYPLTPPGVVCEIEQTFPYRGHRASFRIDFTVRDPADGSFVAFGDWKSCAGPKWALTEWTPEDDLRAAKLGMPRAKGTIVDDLQANLESFGFMTVFGLTEVPVRWLYVDKKTERAWHVDGHFTLAQTDAWLAEHALPWMRLIERLRALHAAGQTPPLAHVPHDPIACDGVGRMCSFLGACQMRTTVGAPTLIQLRQWADQPEE